MSAGTQQVPIHWTPAPPQLVMAYSVCKGITRTAAKNFYYAFLVLPRRKREALFTPSCGAAMTLPTSPL
jgi:hypothetical protein